MSVGRFLQQAAAGAGGPSDDDFANVVLLLDGDGTSGDNNETFTDSSTNGFTVTETGSVVQGSFSPYGDNWSNYFDGVDDYLISDTNFTAIGTDDFTIEFWYNGGAQPARYPCIIGTLDAFGATGAWRVQTYDNNTNRFQFTSAITNYIFTTTNYNDGVWRHFAVTREGTNLRGFVNGVQQGSAQTMSDSFTSRKILMMSQLRDGGDQEGYVSNVRVIKGTALYTSDFTPPTAPLTAVTGTEFLSCQSNRFIDNSSNNFALSANSTPKVTPFSPFKDSDARTLTTDGGSGYFDGTVSTNKIFLADNDALSPEGDDFTLEAWVYTKGSAFNDYQGIWIKWTAGNQEIFFSLDPSLKVYAALWFGSTVNITSANAIEPYLWNHVAITRSGTTVTLWINGNSEATSTVSGSIPNNTDPVYIGNYKLTGFYEFNGYISDVRWVKGTAVYTSAFTPPTAPLTAITNTETLLSFQDSGIYDRSGINNVYTVGNAQIDTAVTKYGTGSMQFDGSGDWLVVPSKDEMNLGTADFTWEAWVWADSATTNNWYDSRSGTGTSDGFMIGTSSSQLFFYTANAIRIQGTPAFTGQTWNHVAVSRESGTTKLFLNGTQIGSSYSDSNNYTQPTIYIGRNVNAAGQFNGYIDDLRITKGVARYTANFTPPTAELPKF